MRDGGLRPDDHGPWGDPERHRPLALLEKGLADLDPPADAGRLELIVARADDGERSTPDEAALSVEGGLPGDAWGRRMPEALDLQLTVMRADFGRLVAGGQPLSLFGDNLIVDLDLSLANLPTGSRLRLGEALLEVTPEPHTGCRKYRQRFGGDALRVTADRRFRDLRLRGLYVKVVLPGRIAVGDEIRVERRGGEPARP
jgi:hypothetical protein